MQRLMKMILFVLLSSALPALAADVAGKMYKNPNCDCCEEHAKYLNKKGYKIEVIPTKDMKSVREKYKVPEQLVGCHLTVIDGYAFEGHMPAESIERFLKERPKARGLSVPGMPQGSPGMSGKKQGPMAVYYINDSSTPEFYEAR